MQCMYQSDNLLERKEAIIVLISVKQDLGNQSLNTVADEYLYLGSKR